MVLMHQLKCGGVLDVAHRFLRWPFVAECATSGLLVMAYDACSPEPGVLTTYLLKICDTTEAK